MMNPTLPGWKVECVGDDIAWMKFDGQGESSGLPDDSYNPWGVAGLKYATFS